MEIKIKGLILVKKMYLTYNRVTPDIFLQTVTNHKNFRHPSLILMSVKVLKCITACTLEDIIFYLKYLTDKIPYTLKEDIFKPPDYSTQLQKVIYLVYPK